MLQFAMEGLRHQLSQGSANWTVDPGDRFTFYRLMDSVEPAKPDKDGHEKDFFDGIDTSLAGLAARLGPEETKVPKLRQDLTAIAQHIAEAREGAKGSDLAPAAQALMRVVAGLDEARAEVGKSTLSAVEKSDLLARLEEKSEQAESA